MTRNYTEENEQLTTLMNGATNWAKNCNTEARLCTGNVQNTTSDY